MYLTFLIFESHQNWVYYQQRWSAIQIIKYLCAQYYYLKAHLNRSRSQVLFIPFSFKGREPTLTSSHYYISDTCCTLFHFSTELHEVFYPFSRREQVLKDNLRFRQVGGDWTVLEFRFACLQILFSCVSTIFE